MKIQQKSTNRLFFNQYRFSVTLSTAGIGLLRHRSHETIDRIIEKNNKCIKNAEETSTYTGGIRPIGGISTIFDSFAVTETKTLHEILDFITEEPDTRLVHAGWLIARLYFNDISIVDKLKKINNLHLSNLTERIIDHPVNSIVLKNSDFKFRSYLSQTKSFDYTLESNIRAFLETQPPEDFKPSPLLKKWINNKKLSDNTQQQQVMIFSRIFYPRPSIIEDQMFLDHNNKSIISMMNLIRPGTIRKTVDIIVDK